MGQVIALPNGKTDTIYGIEDIVRLVGELIGDDARMFLEDYLAEPNDDAAYARELEKEIEELWAHHKEVMRELRSLSETEVRIIQQREIDRSALSTTAGKISAITWREINVR